LEEVGQAEKDETSGKKFSPEVIRNTEKKHYLLKQSPFCAVL
jgi:hypothetical protein